MNLSPVAQNLLAYLALHPDAQDTVEGIAKWWLLEQSIRRVISEVRQALVELLANGLVLERAGRDGRVWYRLNRRRRKAIARYVGGASLHSTTASARKELGKK